MGLAFGAVLSREGDFYGPIVNLAARITNLAPAHGLLTTLDATRTLTDTERVAVEPLGAIDVRGITDPVELAALVPR